MTDAIGEFLGAAVVEKETIKNEIVATTNELEAKNREAKFDEASDYVNENLKNIIDTSMESLPALFRVMNSSEDPKMYQVGAAFIKTLSEINKTYYEVNKPAQLAKSDEKTATGGTTYTQNVQINNSEVKMQKPCDLLDD